MIVEPPLRGRVRQLLGAAGFMSLVAILIATLLPLATQADSHLPNGQVVDANGHTQIGIGSGITALAPTTTFAIGSGTSSNTVVEATPGRIFSVLITSTNTAALVCYDNATTNSGTIVVSIAASAAVGIYPFNIPLANGLTCAGNANAPGVTIATS